MSVREWMLACLLAAAGLLITFGAYSFDADLGFVVGGVLLAVWGWFVLGEVESP